jgi:hypothetical protein
MGDRGSQVLTLATLLLLCFLGPPFKLINAQAQVAGPALSPTPEPTPSYYIDPNGVCPDGLDACFARFNETFQKGYTGGEADYRKAVFYTNVLLIDARNRENRSYTLAINEFADLTGGEFLAGYTGAVPPSEGDNGPGRRLLKDKRGLWGAARSLLNLPSSVDWRTSGKLQPVQRQTCGEWCLLPLMWLSGGSPHSWKFSGSVLDW